MSSTWAADSRRETECERDGEGKKEDKEVRRRKAGETVRGELSERSKWWIGREGGWKQRKYVATDRKRKRKRRMGGMGGVSPSPC